MLLFFAVELLDVGDVFLFFFDDVGVGTSYKKVMATTLFLPPTTLRNSLLVLVFFASLALVGGKFLEVLVTRYVNGRSVNRLIFSRVFFLFFCRLYPQENFELILRVYEDGCSNVFASTITAFSTASSQKSNSWSWVSNCTRMEAFRFFWKYWIKISLFRVATGLNSCKTTYKYSRYAV